MRLRDVGLAVLVAVLWAGSYTMAKYALVVSHIPPLLLVALRLAVAAGTLVLWVRRPRRETWRWVGMGAALGLQFGLLFAGMRAGVSTGLAALLLQSQVLFTTVLAVFVFREHLLWHQWLGMGIALLGGACLTWGMSGSAKGVVLVLLAGLMWSVYIVLAKGVREKGQQGVALVIWPSLIAVLPLVLASWGLEGKQWAAITWTGNAGMWLLLAVLYMAWLATLVGYVLWGRLMQRYPAGVVAPFSLLTPGLSMLSGWLFLREGLSLRMVLCTLLILVGIVGVVLPKRVFAKHRLPLTQRTP